MPERVCAYEGCRESLEGRRSNVRFCNRKCSNANLYSDPAKEAQRVATLKAAEKAWREANREKDSASSRRWQHNNPERAQANRDRWFAENPDRHRALRRSTEYRRRARKAAADIYGVTLEHIQARFDYYGGKCWMCGDPATGMDHVKPLAKGGAHIASNLRPACVPCNSSKQHKWYGVPELHRFILHTDPSVSDQAA